MTSNSVLIHLAQCHPQPAAEKVCTTVDANKHRNLLLDKLWRDHSKWDVWTSCRETILNGMSPSIPLCQGSGKPVEEAEGENTKETNDSRTVQSHRDCGSMHRICTDLGQMGSHDETRSGHKTSSLAQELSPNDNH